MIFKGLIKAKEPKKISLRTASGAAEVKGDGQDTLEDQDNRKRGRRSNNEELIQTFKMYLSVYILVIFMVSSLKCVLDQKFIKSAGEIYKDVKRGREFHGCGEEYNAVKRER